MIPPIIQQMKTILWRPPEHRKYSPQQFLTKLNQLVKKSVNNPTKLEFRLKFSKNIRRTNHFLNASFHNI